MKKITTVKTLITILIILLAGGIIGVYFWQHSEVKNLDNKVSTLKTNLKSTSASLQKQNSSLSTELNQANQAIKTLSQNNTFVAGSSCQDAQLQLSYEQNLSGGFGGTGAVFSYQNISSTSCTLEGYPGFLALNNTGHVEPDGPISTGYGGVSNKSKITPTPVMIDPGDKAYFVVVGWSNMMAAEGPCFNTSLIESTPPGNTIPLITTASIQMCGGGTPGPISALATLQGLNNAGINDN